LRFFKQTIVYSIFHVDR